MNTTSKPRPRTKPPEERRDDLMNAAQILFLKKGIGATTIEEITAGADVAKGTFYLHFSSKEDVHAALGERFVRHFVADLQATITKAEKADWRGKLGAWVKAAVAGFLDNGPLVDMLFHAHPRPPHEGPNLIVEHLTEVLDSGARAGAWSIEDPDFTAVFLFGGLHGIIDDVLLGKKRINRAQVIKRLQQHFFRTVDLSTD